MPKKFHYDFDTHEFTTEGPVDIGDATNLAINLAAKCLFLGGVKPEDLEESANVLSEMIATSYKKLVENENQQGEE